jgi:hypothetical protein
MLGHGVRPTIDMENWALLDTRIASRWSLYCQQRSSDTASCPFWEQGKFETVCLAKNGRAMRQKQRVRKATRQRGSLLTWESNFQVH